MNRVMGEPWISFLKQYCTESILGLSVCVCVCVYVSVCVCVCLYAFVGERVRGRDRERERERKHACMYVSMCVHRCEAVGVQLGTNLLCVIPLISECNPFIVKPPEHVHIRQRKVKLIKN